MTFTAHADRVTAAWKGKQVGHDKATCPICNRRDFVGDDHTLQACWYCTNSLVNGALIRTKTGEIVLNPENKTAPVLDVLPGGLQSGRKPRVSTADAARASIRAIKGLRMQGSRKGQ